MNWTNINFMDWTILFLNMVLLTINLIWSYNYYTGYQVILGLALVSVSAIIIYRYIDLIIRKFRIRGIGQ